MSNDFYNKKILTKLRNRTYFQQYNGDILSGEKQYIKSQGAWKITIYLVGTNGVNLIDSAGTEILLLPAPAGFGGMKPALVLGGEPAVTRDDQIELDFLGAGTSILIVLYDRLVFKKEDNKYPLDTLLEQE